MEPDKQVTSFYEQHRASLHYWWRDFSLLECMKDLRQSRKLVLFIVFVALLLDNMLMTVVGKGQFYYNKLQTKTVLEQNTQLGNLIPLLDNELVHFGISRTLTFQVWQFPIPVLILSFLLLQAILHGDNKGDCLHAPLFLPWCP